ncbi:MAG TPA: hypothetical protein VH418_07905 [Solirubrobacteraceae bacterium]
MTLTIVDMIPRSLSRETQQDSEPSIAVNPANPQQIVATAFTPDPAGGPRAPVYVSGDGGSTWALRTIVPGGAATSDISIAFASQGGALYAGILNFTTLDLNILRTADPFGTAPMTTLVDRPDEDQPWVTAATDGGHDHVFVSHNNFNSQPKTATIELSANARTGAAPAGFKPHVVEHRATAQQDAPSVRTAVHGSGVVYGAYLRWVKVIKQTATALDLEVDVIVVRADSWGTAHQPFTALKDPGDHVVGLRVAKNRVMHFTGSVGPLGQERIGSDLAIAVDPADAANVFLAWCDRTGGVNGTDWTLHVRHSTDHGQTWSPDVFKVSNAKNPSLAINDQGQVALLFQRFVGTGAAARWSTRLSVTADAWATPVRAHILHTALASQPPRQFFPYLGDYVRLVAVGHAFFGVFSGSNLPDMANFPSGVTYQRNANFTTHTLLRTDNVTQVAVSIDPFFFKFTP